jgi:hypothetical protein
MNVSCLPRSSRPGEFLRDRQSGHYRIYDASNKVMCWIYVRQGQGARYDLTDDGKARLWAIAWLSRQKWKLPELISLPALTKAPL